MVFKIHINTFNSEYSVINVSTNSLCNVFFALSYIKDINLRLPKSLSNFSKSIQTSTLPFPK